MRVLVTGSNGFIGKNLTSCLREREVEFIAFTRDMSDAALAAAVEGVDFIFHLAGVNRPKVVDEFAAGNAALTERLCQLIRAVGRRVPVVYASSVQAEMDNPYGVSKQAAEDALLALQQETGTPVFIYRLTNVFGKWCRPNYNSVVATFCHNIAQGLPIHISNPAAVIRLVYIDDVIDSFMSVLKECAPAGRWVDVEPVYETTVGELAARIEAFHDGRRSLITENVGGGLTRALHATYLSYLRPEQFSYGLAVHGDPRGRFVEMLKTREAGQVSFFTAHLGVTRGGHYHHTKTEKFLVIQGKARFRFRNVVTDETFELMTDGSVPTVVETVPGWSHDITNIGDGEMIVILWANEIFDRERPDTYPWRV